MAAPEDAEVEGEEDGNEKKGSVDDVNVLQGDLDIG